MEEMLASMFSPYIKFEFSFPVTMCTFLRRVLLNHFLSPWESAELVFCSEELSSFPCKNQNLTLSCLVGKFKFAIY